MIVFFMGGDRLFRRPLRADSSAASILNYELSITNCEYHAINTSLNQLTFKSVHLQICRGWKWKARRGEAHRARGSGAEGTKTPQPRCPVWLSPEDLQRTAP